MRRRGDAVGSGLHVVARGFPPLTSDLKYARAATRRRLGRVERVQGGDKRAEWVEYR